MRIAIVGPYYMPQMFGVEKIMHAHAHELAVRGHDVCVFTSKLRYPEGTLDVPEEETVDGVKILRLPVLLRKPPKPFSYPSNGGLLIKGLRAALESFNPQVVHAHNVGAPAWANTSSSVASNVGATFFYSTYHHPSRLKLNWLRKLFLRWLNAKPLSHAAKIYHLTRSDFEKLLVDYPQAPRERFSVLAPGVDPPALEPRPSSASRDKTLLFVGRVDDVRKGFAILEAALDQLLVHAAFDYKLIVVGKIQPETKTRLEARYKQRIDIRGIVEEQQLEALYAEAGIFVMPSFYEGFGMPFIEAMRYALPVIGTSVGGVPEVVPPGTGILVAAGDATALAEAILSFITDPARQDATGSAGREWASGFYWSQIIDQLEADYTTSW